MRPASVRRSTWCRRCWEVTTKQPRETSPGRVLSKGDQDSGGTVVIRLRTLLFSLLLASPFASALADEYADTVKLFRNTEPSARLFDSSYGYAVFPTIGKGGAVVGAAHGSGRVYVNGKQVGDTKLTQLTVGPQLGGQAYSQVIFFEDKRAFDE